MQASDSEEEYSAEETQPLLSRNSNDHSKDPILEKLGLHWQLVWMGFRQAMSFSKLVYLVGKHPKLKYLFLRCIILNGGIFLGSMFAANIIIIPTMHLMLASTQTQMATSIFDSLFHLFFTAFWIIPVYLFSFLMNAKFYREIADETFKAVHGKPPSTQLTFTEMLSGEIYRMLLVVGYMVQMLVLSLIPGVGPLISFVMSCYLYAFYAFEYLWSSKGLTLEKRLNDVEIRWEFYLGFGFPCTLFTWFFPTFVSDGFYAIMFPLFIVLAAYATPGKLKKERRALPARLPIFDGARVWNRKVVQAIKNRNNKGGNVKESDREQDSEPPSGGKDKNE